MNTNSYKHFDKNTDNMYDKQHVIGVTLSQVYKNIKEFKEFIIAFGDRIEALSIPPGDKISAQAGSNIEKEIEDTIKEFVIKEHAFCVKIVNAFKEAKPGEWKLIKQRSRFELSHHFQDTARKIDEYYNRLPEESAKLDLFMALVRIRDLLGMDLNQILDDYIINFQKNKDCSYRDFTQAMMHGMLGRSIKRKPTIN
jgi:hypothetical protein